MFSSINDVNIKIEELKSKGILSDFNFKDNLFNSPTDNNSVNTTGLFSYEQRPFVLANINGKQVPFYQSTGSGGKKNVPAGTWYPVVGMAEDGWIMKGSEEEINTFYGIKEFEDTANLLNSELGDIRHLEHDMPFTGWGDTNKISDNLENLFNIPKTGKADRNEASKNLTKRIGMISQSIPDLTVNKVPLDLTPGNLVLLNELQPHPLPVYVDGPVENGMVPIKHTYTDTVGSVPENQLFSTYADYEVAMQLTPENHLQTVESTDFLSQVYGVMATDSRTPDAHRAHYERVRNGYEAEKNNINNGKALVKRGYNRSPYSVDISNPTTQITNSVPAVEQNYTLNNKDIFTPTSKNVISPLIKDPVTVPKTPLEQTSVINSTNQKSDKISKKVLDPIKTTDDLIQRLESLNSDGIINNLNLPNKSTSNIVNYKGVPIISTDINGQEVLLRQKRGVGNLSGKWLPVADKKIYKDLGVAPQKKINLDELSSTVKVLNESLGDIRQFERDIPRIGKLPKSERIVETPIEKSTPKRTTPEIHGPKFQRESFKPRKIKSTSSLDMLYENSKRAKVVSETTKSSESILERNKGISVISLDFETTGINHDINRVTQFGFYDSKTKTVTENAIFGSVQSRPLTQELKEERMKWISENRPDLMHADDNVLSRIVTPQDILYSHEIAGAGAFGKEQLERGSFDKLAQDFNSQFIVDKNNKIVFNKDISKRNVVTLEQSLKQVQTAVEDSPRIILIQNANFENTVTETAAKVSNKERAQRLNRSFIEDFNESVYGTKNSRSIFNVDKDIVAARKVLRDNTKEMRKLFSPTNSIISTDSAEFQSVKEAAFSLHNTIQTKISENFVAGKSTVIDLMDITRVYQVALASVLDPNTQKPLLANNFLNMGINVDFLARNVLQIAKGEDHTAGSDSKSQSKLFDFMDESIRQIKESDGSAESIAKIAERNKGYLQGMENLVEHEKQFLSQMYNRVEEISNKLDKEVSSGVLTEEQADKEFLKRSRTAFKDTLTYYNGIDEREGFSRFVEVKEAEHIILTGKRSKEATSFEELKPKPIPSASNHAHDEAPGVLPNHPANAQAPSQTSPPKAFTRQEKVKNLLENLNARRGAVGEYNSTSESIYRNAIRLEESMGTLSKGNSLLKYGLYGVAGMVALDIMAGKPKTETQQQATYDALYGNFYLGQSYADWQERNQSHKMMY